MTALNQSDRVAIVKGLRLPFAKQATDYMGISALELGATVVQELINRVEIDPALIDQLVFGQVIQMPKAPNIAREIVLSTNLAIHTDAYSVSRACATSFQTVVSAAQSILCGDSQIAIAGGADSTSVLPIGVSPKLAETLLLLSKARTLKQRWALIKQLRLKHLAPVPPAIAEYSTGLSMGQTAEQMAKSYQISRASQDELAHLSHSRAEKAYQLGYHDEDVMPVRFAPYDKLITRDNTIREQSDLASYAKLKPVFDRVNGSVTAATSSPLTDGASAVMLMKESRAKALGLTPIGYLKSYAFKALGVKEDMLMGPAHATPAALDNAGMTLADIDLVEMHEAFAAQVLANLNMFDSDTFAQNVLGRAKAIGAVDPDKLNVNGSSIAYGHPFAATGTRIITSLCHELKRRGGGTGLATACAAGGLGAAMIVEVE